MATLRMVWLLHLEAARDRVSYLWSVAVPVVMFAVLSRNVAQAGQAAPALGRFMAYIVWSSACYAGALPVVWKRETGFFRSFCLDRSAVRRVAIAHAVSAWLHACWMLLAFSTITVVLVPHAVSLAALARLAGAAAALAPLPCFGVLCVLALPGGFRALSSSLNGAFFLAFVLVLVASTPGYGALRWISPIDGLAELVVWLAHAAEVEPLYALLWGTLLVGTAALALGALARPRIAPALMR